jgi:hypothetical protein
MGAHLIIGIGFLLLAGVLAFLSVKGVLGDGWLDKGDKIGSIIACLVGIWVLINPFATDNIGSSPQVSQEGSGNIQLGSNINVGGNLIVGPGAEKEDEQSIPKLTNWPDMLHRGEVVVIEVLTVPHALQNSLLIARQHYHVRFLQQRCEWIVSGPIQHPSEGIVEMHTNRASQSLNGRLEKYESETQLSECYLPRQYKMVVMTYQLRFDANGVVYYGSEQFGRLRRAA